MSLATPAMIEQATSHGLERAGLLFDRARLELRPGVTRDQAVAMLARMLDRYDPFSDMHGRLLVAALRARSAAEQQAGRRPPAERAVRRLLATGHAPTPKAVAALEDEARAWQARRERVAPLVERDGACVAEIVAGQWRRQGVGRPSRRWRGRSAGGGQTQR